MRVFDRGAALDVLRAAHAVAQRQAGFLIVRADGGSPGNLRNARGVYAAWCERQELQTHALRYALAHDQPRRYRAEGFSHREPLSAALSEDLGRGDGCGRWVRMVYLRSMDMAESSNR